MKPTLVALKHVSHTNSQIESDSPTSYHSFAIIPACFFQPRAARKSKLISRRESSSSRILMEVS